MDKHFFVGDLKVETIWVQSRKQTPEKLKEGTDIISAPG